MTRSARSITRPTPCCAEELARTQKDAALVVVAPSASPRSCMRTRSSCSTRARSWAKVRTRSSCAAAPPILKSPSRSSPHGSSGSVKMKSPPSWMAALRRCPLMADEMSKTEAPKRQARQAGPGQARTRPRGRKAQGFQGHHVQALELCRVAPKSAVFFAAAFAIGLGSVQHRGPRGARARRPRSCSRALVAKVRRHRRRSISTGIARHASRRLAGCCTWLSAACSLVQGWLMTERLAAAPARIGHAPARSPRRSTVMPVGYFERPLHGRRALAHHKRRGHAGPKPQPVRDAAHHLHHADYRRARDDAIHRSAAHRRRRGHAAGRRRDDGRDDALLATIFS